MNPQHRKKIITLIWPAFIFASPFFLIFLIDNLWLKRYYFSTPTDTVSTLFGMGLNWVALRPSPLLHHPGYFFQAISGILVWLTGLDVDSLMNFNRAGQLVHLFFLTGSALWVADLARKLQLKNYAVLLLGMTTASMPSVALYSGFWSLYFPLSVLSIPICLAIYLLTIKNNSRKAVFWPLAALGFLAANLFMGLFIVAAVVSGLIIIWAKKNKMEVAKQLGLTNFQESSKEKFALFILISIFLLSCFFALAQTFSQLPINNPQKPLLAIALLAGLLALIVSGTLVRKSKSIFSLKIIFYGLLLPFLTGWLFGAHLLSPFWGLSAIRAFLFKGTSGSIHAITFLPELDKMLIAPFLNFSLWHWFLVILLLIGLYGLIKKSFPGKEEKTRARFVGIFCLVALIANLLSAADIILQTYNPDIFQPKNFGQVSRYFILMTSPLALGLAWFSQTKASKIKLLAIILFFSLAIGSHLQYILQLTPTIRAENLANSAITQLINGHLEKNEGNLVVCARTVMPEVCSVLYGYDNCRNHLAIQRLNKKSSREGRILYSENLNETCKESLGGCLDLSQQSMSREILLITENYYAHFLPPEAQLIWDHPDSDNSVWLIKNN